MRLLKPAWVSHEGKPIFSIDIHPDGSRFATGGQGNNSGKVAIWSMAPVRDESAEKDENVPKLICQMDNHLACVNCVRWSIDGRYLASAGDDKLIMIWQFSRTGGMSSTFGSMDKMVNIETWRAVHILRGHAGDVLDISWSPDNSMLASCSIDNNVIIWNVLKFPEQITTLKGHTGLVKGVTWDPICKYIASQSDDRTVRIWRTYDWKVETVISEPFKECCGTTHVLRLSWSPDGQYVVSAHAMNNSGPTAQIIERGNSNGWVTKMDFVGHRKAITVVRFNSRMFSKRFKKNPDVVVPYTCCAVGSRDRSISVWLTALRRPLVVMHDLFNNSVLDISWSSNGTELMCCSWDGTVAYFEFSFDEIGTPMSVDEKLSIHKQLYGDNILQPKNSVANRIVESTEVLELHEQKDADKQQKTSVTQKPAAVAVAAPARPLPPSCAPDGSNSMSAILTKQIETRTKDGRRRITPIFLAPQPDVGDVPQPFTTGGATSMPVFSSSKETSSIVVEKKDEITSPMGASCSSRSNHEAPVATQNRGLEIGSASNSRPAVEIVTGATVGDQPPANQQTIPEKVNAGSSGSVPSTQPGIKLKNSGQDEPPKKKDGRGRPRKDRTLEVNRPSTPAAHTVAPAVVASVVMADREPPRPVVDTVFQLPVPTIDTKLTFPIPATSGEQLMIEIDNNIRLANGIMIHRVRCTSGAGQDIVWESLVNSKLNAVAGSSSVVCAASEDHCLHLFTTATGSRMCSPIVLSAAISQLRCTASYVMALTSLADVSVWNVKAMTCTVKNVSIDYLLSGDVSVERSRLTTDGIPVLMLSNGQSFSYSVDMSCWLLLTSRDDVLSQSSDHQSGIPTGVSRPAGLLTELQASSRSRSGIQGSNLFRSDAAMQRSSTVSHLEQQLASCLAIRSPKEYHFWLFTYIRYLVQEGSENKLRKICEEFLGPVHDSIRAPSSCWEPVIMGYKKHALLREILPIIGRDLRLQRLFTEYQQQLVSVDNL